MTISFTSITVILIFIVGLAVFITRILIKGLKTLYYIQLNIEEQLKLTRINGENYYHDPLEYSKIDIHDYFADLIYQTNKNIVTYFDTKFTYAGSQDEIALIANHYYDKAVENIDQLLYLTELSFKTNKNVAIVCIVNRKIDTPENDKHTVYITFNSKEYWEDKDRYNNFMDKGLSKLQEEKIDYLKTKYF